MYKSATKKRPFIIVLFIALFIFTGALIFVGGGTKAAAATEADEVYSAVPAGLSELRSASEGQLEYWAGTLDRFDGRDYGYVTSAKYQPTPTCWAYAAIGVAEANILRSGIDGTVNKDSLDLDEDQVAWAVVNRDGSVDPLGNTANDSESDPYWSSGGRGVNAFEAMSQDYTPLKQGAEKTCNEKSKYRTKNIIGVHGTEAAIKEAVIKYGAVLFSYKSPSGFSLYYRATGKANHESIIVGWDDGISKSNFSGAAVDGAWIVKNSWGNHGASVNGVYCYYLSYDSEISDINTAEMGLTSEYENYYYYDGLVGDSPFDYSAKASEYAAIYQAKKASAAESEIIDAVYLGIKGNAVDCTVTVYTGLNPQPGDVNSEFNDPTLGTPALSNRVSFKTGGHYTVNLSPVELGVGEWFSIVVKVSNPENNASIFLGTDSSINDMTYYREGGVWTSFKREFGDVHPYADGSKSRDVARIRAFTHTEQRSEPLDKSIDNALILIDDRFEYYMPGELFTPSVSVYFGGELLREGEHYTLKYKNNFTPNLSGDFNNDAAVVVSGTGEFCGSREEKFAVAKPYMPYNTPAASLTVYRDTTRLHQIVLPEGWVWIDRDCDLKFGRTEYAVNIRYEGSDVDFYRWTYYGFYVTRLDEDSPDKINISDCDISVIGGGFVYTGEQIQPQVSVTLSGAQLVRGVDYRVDYSDNINAGTAKVTVTGMGNYVGTATEAFTINKADMPDIGDEYREITVSEGKTLKDVKLPVGWDWVNPDTKLEEGTHTYYAIYGDNLNYNTALVEITVTLQVQPDPDDPNKGGDDDNKDDPSGGDTEPDDPSGGGTDPDDPNKDGDDDNKDDDPIGGDGGVKRRGCGADLSAQSLGFTGLSVIALSALLLIRRKRKSA